MGLQVNGFILRRLRPHLSDNKSLQHGQLKQTYLTIRLFQPVFSLYVSTLLYAYYVLTLTCASLELPWDLNKLKLNRQTIILSYFQVGAHNFIAEFRRRINPDSEYGVKFTPALSESLVFMILKGVTEFLGRGAKRQVDRIARKANDNGGNGNVKSYCRFHRINL